MDNTLAYMHSCSFPFWLPDGTESLLTRYWNIIAGAGTREPLTSNLISPWMEGKAAVPLIFLSELNCLLTETPVKEKSD